MAVLVDPGPNLRWLPGRHNFEDQVDVAIQADWVILHLVDFDDRVISRFCRLLFLLMYNVQNAH